LEDMIVWNKFINFDLIGCTQLYIETQVGLSAYPHRRLSSHHALLKVC